MQKRYVILFTLANVTGSMPIYYGLEYGSVFLPFIFSVFLVIFNGAVLAHVEEL